MKLSKTQLKLSKNSAKTQQNLKKKLSRNSVQNCEDTGICMWYPENQISYQSSFCSRGSEEWSSCEHSSLEDLSIGGPPQSQ